MPELLLVGDVMLGRGVDAALPAMTPREPWGDFLPDFLAAEASIVNLECALTVHDRPWSRTRKVFHFRADPSAVSCLQAASVSACSLANNHTLDFEEPGLEETLVTLDRAGIARAGAGLDLAEARKATLIPLRGLPARSIALIAATDNSPEFAAGPERPGTNYLEALPTRETMEWIRRSASSARESGAELVVFSYHCGPNMVQRPTPAYLRFARAVIDQGVDIYHGHSAHVFQGVELYREKVILHDTGDFLDDYAVDPELRNDWSFLFRIRFEPSGPREIELIPARLGYARVGRAAGKERDAILERMQALSLDLGTRFARKHGRLVLSGLGAAGTRIA